MINDIPGLLKLIFLTIVYLVVELTFNASLVDVVGSVTDKDTIDSIEIWGRVLSGLALTLAIWGFVSNKIFTFVAMSVFIVPAVFYAEKSFLDNIVENSTNQERYIASNVVILQQAIKTNEVKFTGLDISPEEFKKPDGKAFLALFPYQLMNVENIVEKIQNSKRELIYNRIDNSLGGVTTSFAIYSEYIRRSQIEYNDTVKNASQKQNDAIKSIQSKQKSDWADYKNKLKEFNWTPETVPQRFNSQVREMVQKQVPVSNSWMPYDQQGFYNAIAGKAKSKMVKQISFDEFFNSQLNQSQLLQLLHFPEGTDLSKKVIYDIDTYDKRIYQKSLNKMVDQKIANIDKPLESYSNENAELGKTNVKLIFAPMLALIFSTFGALVHIVKSALLIVKLFTGKGGVGMLAIVLPVVLIFFTFVSFSKITEQDLYRQTLSQNNSGVVGHMINIPINAQTLIYPVSETLRFSTGITFGYDKE